MWNTEIDHWLDRIIVVGRFDPDCDLCSVKIENTDLNLFSVQQHYSIFDTLQSQRFIFFYTDEIDISEHFIYKFNDATTLSDCKIHTNEL